MVTILVSLLCAVAFFLITVLTINYAVFALEHHKIDDMVKTVGHTVHNSNTDFVEEEEGFSISKSLNRRKMFGMVGTENALAKVRNMDYSSLAKKFFTVINHLRKDTWSTIKTFFKWIISTLKPADETTFSQKVEFRRKQDEIEETAEKVASINNSGAKYGASTFAHNNRPQPTMEEEVFEMIEDENIMTDNLEGEEGRKSNATLSFASEKEEEKSQEMSVFEKLEMRVLNKLKNAGMDNYDIWLELGDLYAKFDEKEKAKEVYALILKHSQGGLKEMARNRLIGLS